MDKPKERTMVNTRVTTHKQPITLYNALDRYSNIVTTMKVIEEEVEKLKVCAHPGVFDLVVHFTMLKQAKDGAAQSFSPEAKQSITPKSIRMLTNLEHLVDELKSIVEEASAELLP
ncbi:hypothetical protein [Marinobacter nauticus]|uniref:hypothetical protein n=1 Tax=Marinobacter nauticus TaxID=2743 RepID=UPI0012F994F4|nr:hypothetical protein [Marinobacter nauticus]